MMFMDVGLSSEVGDIKQATRPIGLRNNAGKYQRLIPLNPIDGDKR